MTKKFNEEQQNIIDLIRKTIGNRFAGDMLEEIPDSIFYTPEEWTDRKEEYGLNSKLIVTHDGGLIASFFNLDYGSYNRVDSMIGAFDETPYYFEGCTCWYSAVYLSYKSKSPVV